MHAQASGHSLLYTGAHNYDKEKEHLTLYSCAENLLSKWLSGLWSPCTS